MISVPCFRNAAFLLCLGVMVLRADVGVPNAVTPPAESKSWSFAADTESERSVTLLQGETIDQVIAKMGEPRKRWKKKKDPLNQELGFKRIIPGPVQQKQVRTRDGFYTVRYQVRYFDEMTLFFKDEKLQNVKTYRTRSDDSNYVGLPPFVR